MDIMRPPLEQQVAPAPWLVPRSNVDVPALIRRTLTQQPDASVDDIVRQLGVWGVQMSGIIVFMWMPRLRGQEVAEQIADGQSSAIEASPSHEITSSCSCNPLPCICCEPTSAWRHQDCCGILVSEEQTKSRDKYLEHTWFVSMRSDDEYANRLAD